MFCLKILLSTSKKNFAIQLFIAGLGRGRSFISQRQKPGNEILSSEKSRVVIVVTIPFGPLAPTQPDKLIAADSRRHHARDGALPQPSGGVAIKPHRVAERPCGHSLSHVQRGSLVVVPGAGLPWMG
jgi:hypothetical protein